MYRTIIVPLDGSARSQGALPVAAKLAAASGAELALVRVHRRERPDLDDDPSWDDMFRQGEQQHLNVLAEAYEPVAGRVSTALLDGPVIGALAEFAAERQDSLVVIAARGRTGLRRAVLGSVSDALVRQGPVPVLILRDRPDAETTPPLWMMRERPFRTVVVPVDGTAHSEAAWTQAVDFARVTGARLHLIRVIGPVRPSTTVDVFAMHPHTPYDETMVIRNDLAHEYLQGLIERAAASGPKLEVTAEVALSTQPAKAITESCNRHAADLVVMATHGRGASRLIVGAVGDQVLRDGPDAILFVRPDAEVADPRSSPDAGASSERRIRPPIVVH